MNKILKPEKYEFVLAQPSKRGEYWYVDLYTFDDTNQRTYLRSFYVDDKCDVFKALFSSRASSGYFSIIEICHVMLLKDDKPFCETCKRLGLDQLAGVSSLDELKLRLMVMGNEI